MKRPHLILKNNTVSGTGIYKYNGFGSDVKKEDDVVLKDYTMQRKNFRFCHSEFISEKSKRKEKRDNSLNIPHYEYIRIDFFKVFDTKDFAKWGLVEVARYNMGMSILAYIKDYNVFEESFLDLIYEYSNDDNIKTAVPDEYEQFTIIDRFELQSSQRIGCNNVGRQIIRLIPKDEIPGYNNVLNSMNNYLKEAGLIQMNGNLYEINNISQEKCLYIKDNFDIIQKIESVPYVHIGPNDCKMLKFNMTVDIDKTNIDELPIVGLIDTGIKTDIEAFDGLIYKQVSLIDGPIVVNNSHGTNVASLIVFGNQPLTGRLYPQARIYSIQVINDEEGRFSLYALKNAIIKAVQDKVKVFNISMSSSLSKDINSDMSEYAKMLDDLAFNYDLVFNIATGNNFDRVDDIPYIFYDYNDPNNTQDTNLGEPAECMNGITVGAACDNQPALYTKKSHLDYTMLINHAYIEKATKNNNLMKPDLLYYGGKEQTEESGILVINSNDFFNFVVPNIGTSLATPFISNLCAQLLYIYPKISASSIKSIIINSASRSSLIKEHKSQLKSIVDKRNDLIKKDKRSKDYHTLSSEKLCRMIEGYGIIDNSKIVLSDDNNVTLLIKESIANNEVKVIELNIPESLYNEKENTKMILINTTLSFISPVSDYNNPKNYNSYHVSYRILHGQKNISETLKNACYDKNESEDEKEQKIRGNKIKSAFNSWSETCLPSYKKRFFSNTQHHEFYLKMKDIITVDKKIAIAFRCVNKLNSGVPINFSFCIRLELLDEYSFMRRPFT